MGGGFETGAERSAAAYPVVPQEDHDDPRYSYRVALVPRTGNKPSTADQDYQVVAAGSEMSVEINRVLLKETERTKYRPGTVVTVMKEVG